MLENIPRLAVKHLAQHVERAEANSANLSGLDARKVHVGNAHLLRQLVEGNTAVGHDAIEPENDWHRSHLQRLVREFLQEDAIFEHER